MVYEELHAAGLTEGQTRVYLALLELGPSTNTQLARRSGLQVSSVYYCLNALVEKGFATYVLTGNKRTYRAVDPKEAIDVLARDMEDRQAVLSRFKAAVPDLEQLQQKGTEKNYATVYEGIGGVRSAFNEVLRTLKRGDEYCAINIGEEYLQSKEARQFFRTYHAKRAKMGIKVRFLSAPSLLTVLKDVFAGLKHTEIRLTEQKTPLGIVIYDNRVQTVIWDKKPMAFVTYSKMNAERYRAFFEEVWQKAKPVSLRRA